MRIFLMQTLLHGCDVKRSRAPKHVTKPFSNRGANVHGTFPHPHMSDYADFRTYLELGMFTSVAKLCHMCVHTS